MVVSAETGVPLERLQTWLDHDRVVKIMPTILPDGPITVYNPHRYPLALPTEPVPVDDEEILDLTTTIALVLEKWIDAAINIGASKSLTEKLILRNLQALGRVNLQTQEDLIDLRIRVSPKRAVDYLDRSALEPILRETLLVADERVLSLKKRFHSDD